MSYVDLSGVVNLQQSTALNVAPGSAAALQGVIGPKPDALTLSSDPGSKLGVSLSLS